MSRYEITDDGKTLFVKPPAAMASRLTSNEMVAGAIRQQQSDLAALKELLAGEVEANEAFRKSGGALDGEDMPTFCARLLSNLASMTKARDELGAHLDQFIAERDQLRAEVADSDELARHFVRDRPTIKARGALILQADEIAKLRARLAAVDAAPVVARVGGVTGRQVALNYVGFPPIGTELIARPAKDGGT